MSYGTESINLCDVSTESPEQRELNSLKYDIRNAQQAIKHQQALLRLARAKLTAVKALVK